MLATVDAEANHVSLPWISMLAKISRRKRPQTIKEKEAERLMSTQSTARIRGRAAARLRKLAEEASEMEKGGQASTDGTT